MIDSAVVSKRVKKFIKMEEIDIRNHTFSWRSRDYLPLLDALLPSLRKKYYSNAGYSRGFLGMVKSVELTLNYLADKELLNKNPKIPKSVKLWKKFVPLGDYYENVRRYLFDAIHNHLRPETHKAISGGAVYSSDKITNINTAIMYTLEWLHKNGCLKNEKQRKKVKKKRGDKNG